MATLHGTKLLWLSLVDALFKMALQPLIVKFAFINYNVKGNTAYGKCKFCKEKAEISDKLGTTSNFVRHLHRKHSAR